MKNRNRLVALMVAVLVAIISAGCASTHPSQGAHKALTAVTATSAPTTTVPAVTTTTAPPPPAPPPPVTAPTTTTTAIDPVTEWFAEHRDALTQLENDVTQLATDAKNSSGAGLLAACQAVDNDASAALGFAPIPNPSLDSTWQAGLGYLQQGGKNCVQGADAYDLSTLLQARSDLETGSEDLTTVTNGEFKNPWSG